MALATFLRHHEDLAHLFEDVISMWHVQKLEVELATILTSTNQLVSNLRHRKIYGHGHGHGHFLDMPSTCLLFVPKQRGLMKVLSLPHYSFVLKQNYLQWFWWI